ncbi:hypothetical protein [Deinococcus sp. Leaf326]|uniref:hypothetical protein n=1 Tax=Deinococcus sp. Leaf326 TaxID=1736338 RepID=UPI000B0E66C0|nr:hypothetical protein [Deinococcus sp. Leaf326]
MEYQTYKTTVSGGVPGRAGTTSLVAGKKVLGTFAAATFQGFSKFFGPQGWQEGGTYTLSTLDTLETGTVLEAEGRRYKVVGGARGRIRNVYYLSVGS